MVKERIRDWVIENRKPKQPGKMPTNILYYRDGVSGAQYEQVRDVELPEIRAAYTEIFQEAIDQKIVAETSVTGVNLTAIVAAKRHRVRFYPVPPKDQDQINSGNCTPGTFLEHVVTSPYFQDLYMQSRAAIKGAARPAHYFIVQEEMGKSVDFYRKLASLTCT